jgi:hypothetical protein
MYLRLRPLLLMACAGNSDGSVGFDLICDEHDNYRYGRFRKQRMGSRTWKKKTQGKTGNGGGAGADVVFVECLKAERTVVWSGLV